jgi:HK97 family phage major capsid protein
MKLEQLRQLAHSKATEAQAILEADEPDVEKANALLDESEGYKIRADQMQKALTLADATKAEEKAVEPEKSGLVVVEDEADKAIKAKPFTGFGDFLMAVKNAALNVMDDRLPSLVSNDAMDEGGYSLNKALGDQFVGGLVKSAYTKQTGLNEGIGSQGGFLVGTDQGGNLMQRVYNVGDLLQRVDMVGISANSNGMTFYGINETSRADGSRRGGIRAYWAAEGGVKTASQPEWREIDLKLKKVVGLVYATDELLQDASALETWILSNLPEELRFVVEDSVVNGTGAGMPQGIIGSGAVVSVAKETGQAADTIVSQNVMKMWSRMWAPSRRTAVWLINQDCEPQLMQMSLGVGTGGQAVYMPPGGLSGAPYGTIFTRPVIPSEYANTIGSLGDIMLLDFNEYQMIEKGGVQSASSIHVRFVYDESVFRFVYRCDGQPKWNSPLTPFKGTNTLSPFITLAARD